MEKIYFRICDFRRRVISAGNFLQAKARSLLQSIRAINSLSVFVAILSMIFGGYQALLLRQQIELENRPFVSIENGNWWYNRDENNSFWLGIGFSRSNYGQRPAEEVEFRNFRAVAIAIDEKGLKERIESRTSEGTKQYLDEYVADERNRLVLKLMDVFSEYFRSHPDTDKKTLETFLMSLSPGSRPLHGEAIFTHNGRLLFSIGEVNNEMPEYYKNQRVFVFPNRSPEEGEITLQMGSRIAEVLDGQALLIVFLAFRYQSMLRDRDYSIFSLRYSGRNLRKVPRGRGGAFLAEFQGWSSEECHSIQCLIFG